jgi:hypothetical protein
VLDAGIEPFDAFRRPLPRAPGCARHLGMLRSEATALVSTLEELRRSRDRRRAATGRVEPRAKRADVARWLRHEAIRA